MVLPILLSILMFSAISVVHFECAHANTKLFY